MANKELSMEDFKWFLPRYTRGKGLQLLNSVMGPLYDHFIYQRESIKDLSIYGSKSLDFLIFGHSLAATDKQYSDEFLRNCWRVIKDDGHFVVVTNMTKEALIAQFEEIKLNNCTLVDEQPALLTYVFKKTKIQPKIVTQPKCLVVRQGARGDNLQASSVLRGLKEQGYHITLMCQTPGNDVLENNPDIDDWFILDPDQVPNLSLTLFWDFTKQFYDKYVNLTESVEGVFLAMKDRTMFRATPGTREKMMNFNYMEFSHDLARIPYKLQVKFHPTLEEKQWTLKKKNGKKFIVFAVGGSSLHKQIPYLDQLIARTLIEYPQYEIYLLGGKEDLVDVEKWSKTDRVHVECGWTYRQSIAFTLLSDLVIGPETGILNAVCCESMPKICYLSHSTVENLTRDWINTTSMYSEQCVCPGRGNNEAKACHIMHFNVDNWKGCKQDVPTGLAECMKNIDVEDSWNAITGCLK